MSQNACCVWDFTIGSDHVDLTNLKDTLKDIAKKWCFQLELGETGYEHYQGRFSLKVKNRLSGVKKIFFKEAHLSITSNENRDNMFYVTKPDTRIAGPWSDKDKVLYIPRQYRNKLNHLYPFQQTIWDSYNVFEDRIINCIICPNGGMGKSTIASLCDLHDRGIDVPPINDSDKLIASVCNILMAKQTREPGIIFIDIPRATDQTRLGGMFAAIEQIKKGKVYDMRYHYKEWWFDAPQIWVFMNIEPHMNYLSRDRWAFWEINEDYELCSYTCRDLQEDLEALCCNT